MAWKYYVYRFDFGDKCMYIGKGSCRRFNVQSKRFPNYGGSIIAYFATEYDALAHEAALIKAEHPALNKLMNKDSAPWLYALMPESDKDFDVWCAALGTRQMAGRILLSRGAKALARFGIDYKQIVSKVDPWCEALNGCRT